MGRMNWNRPQFRQGKEVHCALPERPLEQWTTLYVPFDEKEEAKRLGARWNPELKTWRAPMSAEQLATHPLKAWAKPQTTRPQPQPRQQPAKPRGGGFSEVRDHSLPDCGCTHVAPWEHCDHSEPGLDADAAEHMKAIACR